MRPTPTENFQVIKDNLTSTDALAHNNPNKWSIIAAVAHKTLFIYIYIDKTIGIMSRVFANDPKDQGSISG